MTGRFLALCLAFMLGLVLFTSSVPSVFAQHGSEGKVNVTIKDPDGRIVTGARLELKDLATNDMRVATSSDAGTYNFVDLSIGNYLLTVTMKGFKTEVVSPVVVDATMTTDVEVRLTLGSLNETVEVEAQPPAVESTSNAITSAVDMNEVEQLPLGGRNLSRFSQLTPGYTGTPGGTGSWNGLPVIAQGNNVDGVIGSPSRMKFSGNSNPIVTPRIESIEEMTVQTDSLDLNTGSGQASMQINFVTRRGTNSFHGRVFEDFRNAAINANSWRNDALGLKKAALILNDFGGSVGGPIQRNKLFFFGSFAMSKQPGSITATNTVFTAAAQAGNFVYAGNDGKTHTVNLLNTAHQFSPNLPNTVNSAIASELSSVNRSLSLGTLAAVQGDLNLNTLNWLTPAPVTNYYPVFRVDYNATDRVRMNLAFTNTKTIQPTNDAPIFPGPAFKTTQAGTSVNNYTASYGLALTISPTLINQFKAGFLYNVNRFAYNAAPLYASAPTVFWNYPGRVQAGGIPDNSMSGQNYYLPVTSYYPVFTLSDTMTWQRGGHSFSYGASWWREQDHYWNPPAGFPNFNLGLAQGDPALAAFTSATLPAANSTQIADAQQLYAVLTGRIGRASSTAAGVAGSYKYDPKSRSYVQQIGAYNLDELTKAWGLFFQDGWRIRPSLTINYGLRWDFTGDDHDLGAVYHNAPPDSVYGPTAPGNLFQPGALNGNSSPQLIARPHAYNAWNVSPQPAVGFAWNPQFSNGILAKLAGQNATVIRAGASFRHFTEPFQYFWDAASDFGSFFYQNFSLSPDSSGRVGTYAPGSLSLGNPLPPYAFSPASYQGTANESQFTFLNGTPGVNGMKPNIGQPYTESWNFGIQRALGTSRALEIRYNGNRTLHQWISINPNEVNIFENGFLQEFKNAQGNLAINQQHGMNSFANNGFAGEVPLPIMGAAFTNLSASNGFANSTFITLLQNGAAGDLASRLAGGTGSTPYFCNLVGPSFTPCVTNLNYKGTGAGYPINFFQANPYAAGNTTGELMEGGYSNYNSLQVDFRQQAWRGLEFDGNYTWSHTLGIVTPNDYADGYNAFTLRDLRRSYGPTLYDLRHVVHVSGSFDLPFGIGRRWANAGGVTDKLIGGWNIGTILTYQTGFPFQLTAGGAGNLNLQRTFNSVADGGILLNGVTVAELQNSVGVHRVSPAQNGGRPATFVDFLDPKYLVSAAGGGANNSYLVPNTTPGVIAATPYLYGPHGFYDDISITKAFSVTERVRLNFQSEFLNAFNHPVFGNALGNAAFTPPVNVGSLRNTTFGTGGISNTARQIEFRANLEF